MCNLISILSFDSHAIRVLLYQQHICKSISQYPLFYKIKTEEKNHSAIDIALENNQIDGLNLMIEYIVKSQNNVAFSFLFEDNFTKLITKGVNVQPLLTSQLFCHQFDFELWPQFHTIKETMIMPYDGSIFDLRSSYDKVFNELA